MSLSDPIFIDFGRLATWNCPTDSEGTYGNAIKPHEKDTIPNTAIKETSEAANIAGAADDLDSEPSINLRRKFKGIKCCQTTTSFCCNGQVYFLAGASARILEFLYSIVSMYRMTYFPINIRKCINLLADGFCQHEKKFKHTKTNFIILTR